MRFLFIVFVPLVFFGCGTNFYLNHEPVSQLVTVSQAGRSLELSGESVIMDNLIRARLESDFYRGSAEITYNGSEFHAKYTSLPIKEEMKEYLKDDLYAVFYAGDYPFHSDSKRFGEASMENGVKTVHAEDGYVLYKITYNGKEIHLQNIVRDYTIRIFSETEIK